MAALSRTDLFEIEGLYRLEARWLRKQIEPGKSPSPIDQSDLRRADLIDRGADLIMGMQGLDDVAFDRVMGELRTGYKVMAAAHERAKAEQPKTNGAAA